MARRNNRVVLNRAMFSEITLGMADGLEALAEAVIANTHPPQEKVEPASDTRVDLASTGGTIAYAFGRKVGGTNDAKKPRAIRVKSLGVVVAGGFSFPGHFAEFGTIHEPARPFLTPALMATLPGADAFVAAAMAHRLGTTSQRAAASQVIGDRLAAKAGLP